MLFYEPTFIFGFLPLFLVAFYFLSKFSTNKTILIFLSFSSLIFYGYWNMGFVPLLIFSIILNFFIGYLIEFSTTKRSKKIILFLGLLINISILIFFKYLGMLTSSLLFLINIDIKFNEVELPLGISFFTFLQIAFIVDKYKKNVKSYSFLKYFLFVSFFPHLIAGPLVHHSKLINQFYKFNYLRLDNLSVGFLIFIIGLFKKVIIVGEISPWSDNLFNGASMGFTPSFIDSWVGVLSFSLQIYFDFSAYSDMAIGLSKMIGILLPINFNSPYKSDSLIEFWRRWHITLSSFLKEYLYFNLGGNRKGVSRKYINILFVMTIAGLWHGASWLFVIWGFFHGIFLILNHLIRQSILIKISKSIKILFVFTLVSILWVPFRADGLDAMFSILGGLLGLNGFIIPHHYLEKFSLIGNLVNLSIIQTGSLHVFAGGWQIITLFSLIIFVLFLPNTQQITSKFKPVLEQISPQKFLKIKFTFNTFTGMICGLVFSYILIISIQGSPGEFIYFQF